MSKQRQPEPFKLEIDADETEPNPQARLGFSVPFVESRSMLLQTLECNARSKRACEAFEDTFNEGDDDSSAD
jgi:hypothetical protein